MKIDDLAINGGPKVGTEPWSPWPYFDHEMIKAVTGVLQSGKVNYWTGEIHHLVDGTKVRGETGLFEYEFAAYHGVKHAISLANGTLTLELALEMFGIGTGDEAITTTRTFIASASACVMRGVKPVFADICQISQNITAASIEKLITEKTRAVIVVHLGGWACEMDEIREVLDRKGKEFAHKIYLIEDCAQSLGGEYKGRKLGSIGDAGSFSFCQDKIITTGGEGGMLIMNDDQAYRRAWAFKDHGKDFDKYNQTLKHSLVDYEKAKKVSYYSRMGTNWRMTEMQAAIGRIALTQLDSWNLAHRKKYAKMLDEGFSTIPGLKVMKAPDHIVHPYYKYYVFIDLDQLNENWNRDSAMKAINAEGVPCLFGSTWGIGKEDAWKNVHFPNGEIIDMQQKDDFPNDFYVGSSVLMFQVHPTLKKKHIEATIMAVKKVMAIATK